jgi:hypothetical protein
VVSWQFSVGRGSAELEEEALGAVAAVFAGDVAANIAPAEGAGVDVQGEAEEDSEEERDPERDFEVEELVHGIVELAGVGQRDPRSSLARMSWALRK